jgi:ABC-2 type transport system permease protein
MILLRPLYQASVNRFVKGTNLKQTLLRDGTVIILGLLISTGGYYGTQWILSQLEQLFSLAYLSPTTPLYLVFLILFGLLTISNIVSMSGAFYQSEDIDLILASPINKSKLFFQRFFITAFTTSIISLIFIFPILLAYAVRFKAPPQFFVLALMGTVPFFIIPASIGFIGATALAWLEKLRKSKIMLLLFLALFIFGVLKGVDVIRLIITSRANTQDFSQLTSIFSVANVRYAPSTWLVELIEVSLNLSQSVLLIRLELLWGMALLTLGISSLLFELGYMPAYSTSRSMGNRKNYRSYRFNAIVSILPAGIRSGVAVMKRDSLMLTRDVAQVFQAILLFGIFSVYLYNLRIFSALSVAGPNDTWWRNFLFISNFCMSAFIALAMCTRFVFPSISIDGRAYVTYIVKSPITTHRFVVGKFVYWLLVVSVCHAIVSMLGNFASGGTINQILTTAVISVFTSLGLVGLAIGLGAKFSRFDWEHLSQLAVGYGNIIFMLIAAAWIFICLIPAWFIIVPYRTNTTNLSYYLAWAILIASNSYIAARAIRSGVCQLEQMQN